MVAPSKDRPTADRAKADKRADPRSHAYGGVDKTQAQSGGGYGPGGPGGNGGGGNKGKLGASVGGMRTLGALPGSGGSTMVGGIKASNDTMGIAQRALLDRGIAKTGADAARAIEAQRNYARALQAGPSFGDLAAAIVPGINIQRVSLHNPSTYANGVYHHAWGPAQAAGEIAGGLLGGPLAGTVAGEVGTAVDGAFGSQYGFGPAGVDPQTGQPTKTGWGAPGTDTSVTTGDGGWFGSRAVSDFARTMGIDGIGSGGSGVSRAGVRESGTADHRDPRIPAAAPGAQSPAATPPGAVTPPAAPPPPASGFPGYGPQTPVWYGDSGGQQLAGGSPWYWHNGPRQEPMMDNGVPRAGLFPGGQVGLNPAQARLLGITYPTGVKGVGGW